MFRQTNKPLHILGITTFLFWSKKASITNQINVQADPLWLYLVIEDAVDSTNVNIINENERVLSAYLEIPFLVNQDDQDNDGLIDILIVILTPTVILTTMV